LAPFATQLYGQLAAGQDGKNLAFAPLNIAHALALTAMGTAGETRREILGAIDLKETVGDQAFAYTLKALVQGVRDPNTLKAAANLWTDRAFPVSPAFTDRLAAIYGPAHETLSFSGDPEGARAAINERVASQVEDLIKEILPPGSITPDVAFVITTTMYLKMLWASQFSKDQTYRGAFTMVDGSKADTELMIQRNREFPYYYDRQAGVKVIELPSRDADVSFYALLPHKVDETATSWPRPVTSNIRDLETQLTPENLAKWFQALDAQTKYKPTLDKVVLPRFEIDSGNLDLIPALRALGINEVFDNADFSAMNPTLPQGKLNVTDVRHQTVVKINEEGGEAAAATAVVGTFESAVSEPNEFVADRPFVFMYRDKKTGHILFLGRLAVPTTVQDADQKKTEETETAPAATENGSQVTARDSQMLSTFDAPDMKWIDGSASDRYARQIGSIAPATKELFAADLRDFFEILAQTAQAEGRTDFSRETLEKELPKALGAVLYVIKLWNKYSHGQKRAWEESYIPQAQQMQGLASLSQKLVGFYLEDLASRMIDAEAAREASSKEILE
jgi:serpin B